MQEFNPFSPMQPPHLSENYFPVITREPTPDSYYQRARHNAKMYVRNSYDEQLRHDYSALIGVSELVLLALATFANESDAGRRAKRGLHLRRNAQIATNVSGLPYTIPAVAL